MKRSHIVIAALFIVTTGAALIGAGDDSDGTLLTYIALGDSVATGNALDALPADPCLRGAESYPVLVHSTLDETSPTAFRHLACSGARIVDPEPTIQRCDAQLTATNEIVPSGRNACGLKAFRQQVTDALELIDDQRTLVTITVGANDTSWTDPLMIVGLLLAPDHIFRAEIERITSDVSRVLAVEIERLLGNDEVTIILTDYYNPLNPESNLYGAIRGAQSTAWGLDNVGDEPCTGTDRSGNEHRLSCADRFAFALDALNTMLKSLTSIDPERVFVASVDERFRGHEAPEGECGAASPTSGESWIRGLVDDGGVTRPDCFHPNALGADAMATAVLEVWKRRAGAQ